MRPLAAIALLTLSLGAQSPTIEDSDNTQTLDELIRWQNRLNLYTEHVPSVRSQLERETKTPAMGTLIPVDQSVVNWHLETLRAAVASSSDKSWEVANLCMQNLLTIGVRDEKPAMRELCRVILLEKELPVDCERWVHVSALNRALSPFITSDDPEDKQFAMTAERPSFWTDRLQGKRCRYYPEQAFPGKSDEETFVLYMRWCVVKNFAGLDAKTAVELTGPILARQGEDPRYLALVRKEHEKATTILKLGYDPEIVEMLNSI